MRLIDAEALDKRLEHQGNESATEGNREAAWAFNMARVTLDEMPGVEAADLWVSTAEREPRHEDADSAGCVLAWHMLNGVCIAQYLKVMHGSFYTHWMRVPGDPKELKSEETAEAEKDLA